MTMTYGTREIIRNPSLLRINGNDSFIIEDKKAHKRLGIYIGTDLAKEFFTYIKRQKLLESARKIKESAKMENSYLNGSLNDGL